MALEKSNIPIAFAQGLDTKTDPKQIPAGKFLNLENAVFLKTGEIRKRNGFKEYDVSYPTDDPSKPMGCTTFKNQLFMLDRKRGFSYTPDVTNYYAYTPFSSGQFDVGNVTKNVGIASSVRSCAAPDTVNNRLFYIYEYTKPNFTTFTLDTLFSFSLNDMTTQAIIRKRENLQGRNPKVITHEAMNYYLMVYEKIENIVAELFTPGTLFEITELGNTNWNSIGYVGIPVVGGRFVSTGYAFGTTGKAGTISLYAWGVDKNNIDSTYNIFQLPNYSGHGYTLAPTYYPKIVYTYGNTGADTAIVSFSPTSMGVSVTPTVLSGTSCRVGASVSGSHIDNTSHNLIALNDGSNIRTIVYNDTLTTVINPLRVAMTASAGDSFNGVVASYLDSLASKTWILFTTTTRTPSTSLANLPRIERAIVTGTTTVEAKTNYLLGAAIAGPAFTIDPSYFEITTKKRSYLPVKMIEQFNSPPLTVYDGVYSSYLINFWDTFGELESLGVSRLLRNTSCKFLSLNTRLTLAYAGFPLNQYNHFPEYYNFTTGYYKSGPKAYALVPDVNGDSYLYEFNKTTKPTYAELGNALFVTGGILRMFDGFSFCEHNFLHQPLQPSLSSPGAGNIPPGTYYYQVTYEWRDASGQVHISSPSDPVNIVLSSSTHRVSIDISTLKLTNKQTPIWIGVYRSNDGFLYYKLPNTGVGGSLYNDSDQTILTITDNISQTFIASQELLYTVGGELNNSCVAACNFVTTYKRRLMVVPSEDTNSFLYSKEIIPLTADTDAEPVNFAVEYVQPVTEEDGKVTGLAEMDDKLIIFKTTGISVMVGSGPAPNGTNNDFTLPQRLATDTGCLYGRSIILSPLGLLFQSPKGFYLLDRSLTVSYIGAPIEAYNTIECMSANLMYDRNEIWFALQDGKTIVFNYYFNQFSNFPSIIGANLNQQATIYKGNYLIACQRIKIETPGIYQDEPYGFVAWSYPMKVTTGWMSFAQVQGFQRVYKLLVLGEYKSPHRLQVQASVDFDDTVVQTSVITPTATPPYEYRFFMTRQKCTAVKFTIQDLQPVSGTYNQGYTLSNMAFEVGVKKGLNKLPASKTAG